MSGLRIAIFYKMIAKLRISLEKQIYSMYLGRKRWSMEVLCGSFILKIQKIFEDDDSVCGKPVRNWYMMGIFTPVYCCSKNNKWLQQMAVRLLFWYICVSSVIIWQTLWSLLLVFSKRGRKNEVISLKIWRITIA